MKSIIYKPMGDRDMYTDMLRWWAMRNTRTFSETGREFGYTPQHTRNIIASELGKRGIPMPVRPNGTFGPRVDYAHVKERACAALGLGGFWYFSHKVKPKRKEN